MTKLNDKQIKKNDMKNTFKKIILQVGVFLLSGILVKFGNYLFSERRKIDFIEYNKEARRQGQKQPIPVSEAFNMVHQSDIDNFFV